MQLIDACLDLYKGSFVNGRREGLGTFVGASGETYEGEWKDDKRCGKGKKKFWDGSYYRGESWLVFFMEACTGLMRLCI